MRTIANIFWVILGGWLSALLWILAAILMAISIIGIPWARACVDIAKFSFWPFGSRLVPRAQVTDRNDMGTGGLGLIGNIIWFILGGWYLALSHLVMGLAWCITIIGIPFGVAHFRLSRQALAPIGMMVVPREVAARH
ncbi:YccF domain-containing protein [Fretibacter rubidus]|uniref:YccF domain-containing protein n=1 Tax=Fretibacter rubidus TaxID=570162 RepID=UPI00352BB379